MQVGANASSQSEGVVAETYFKKNKMKGAVCICDNSVGRVGHMIRHILYGMKMLERQGIGQGTKLNVLTLQSSLFLVEPYCIGRSEPKSVNHT